MHLAKDLLEQTYDQHGAFPDIVIEIRAIHAAPSLIRGVLVVTYEEWHRDGPDLEGRFCSATIGEPVSPNSAVVWLHIHESSIAAPSAA